jgi:cytochrome d ubiquinol oxidase subunit I
VQIWLGDSSGKLVFHEQPAKGAAIEGDWSTNPPGHGAPWAVIAWPDQARQRNDWAITIPDVLSLLATGTLTGRVIGLRSIARDDQPPLLPLLFYAFRVMAGIGFALFILMLASVVAWGRGRLESAAGQAPRWLLIGWVAAVPLGYVATYCGWIVREVGRQPWIIYGLMRTAQGASVVPPVSVSYTLAGFVVIDAVLLASFLIFAKRIIRRGPDMAVRVPSRTPRLQEFEGRRTGPT